MRLQVTLLLSCCLLFYATEAFDITQLLSKYPDFSTFNKYLTQTQLASEINSHRGITILVADNEALSSLSGKSLDFIRHVLRVHVLFGYYDAQRLQTLPGKTAIISTLFQTSGLAKGLEGFLNASHTGTGSVVIGSAIKGSTSTAKLVKSVVQKPYNISVLQISNVIIPYRVYIKTGSLYQSPSSSPSSGPTPSNPTTPSGSPPNPPSPTPKSPWPPSAAPKGSWSPGGSPKSPSSPGAAPKTPWPPSGSPPQYKWPPGAAPRNSWSPGATPKHAPSPSTKPPTQGGPPKSPWSPSTSPGAAPPPKHSWPPGATPKHAPEHAHPRAPGASPSNSPVATPDINSPVATPGPLGPSVDTPSIAPGSSPMASEPTADAPGADSPADDKESAAAMIPRWSFGVLVMILSWTFFQTSLI